MRVEITDRALMSAAPDCGDVLLLSIFAMGIIERHRIFVSDPDVLNSWMPTASQGLIRDEVELALSTSEQADAQGTRRIHTIIVDDTVAEQWSLPSTEGEHLARLRPRAALSLLGRPLRVLLENRRNDRDFLLAFSSAAQRQELEGAAQRGWLDFSTAGGITGLIAILDEEEEQHPDQLLRTVAIADSDARYPGAPSRAYAPINPVSSVAQ